MKTICMIVIGYLWSALALATVKPEPLPEKQSQTQAQGQTQGQMQGQEQLQGQSQRAEAQALSNSESAAQAGATATSSSGGNTQSTHIVTRESAAALAQGSIMLGGRCSFGGNAGGSGRGGAGFLGLAFCTPQDNDFTLAGFYFTIGDYETGCKIIAETPTGKRQLKRGITLPQCQNPPTSETALPPPVVIEKPADCPACPDCDKAFKQCVAK